MEVRVGSWVARGGEGSGGFFIEQDGFTGWDDGVDVRRDSSDRPQAHGSFDSPGFLSSRVISISGLCHAGSAERMGWYGSQLTGVLADGGLGQIVVADHEGSTLYANGRLASKPKFDSVLYGRISRYQIQFWCADPRKYGETRAFTGEPAYHYGNFPASPVLTVSGSSASGYTVTGPGGKAYVVTKALVSGHPHTIDMSTGLLSVDGVVQSGAVSTAETWTVPPGQQVTMSVSAGSLSVAVKDTYI